MINQAAGPLTNVATTISHVRQDLPFGRNALHNDTIAINHMKLMITNAAMSFMLAPTPLQPCVFQFHELSSWHQVVISSHRDR